MSKSGKSIRGRRDATVSSRRMTLAGRSSASRGNDDPPLLHAHLAHFAVACYEAIHTGKELGQLASPLLQTHGAVFGSADC